MNTTMDRRGFLKAMLVLAGSVVAPSFVSSGPRESVYVPKIKHVPLELTAVPSPKRFMCEPDITNGIYRNRALSRKLRYASMARVYLVAADGTGDFRTIQEGVNACQPGDTVAIKSGTYELSR